MGSKTDAFETDVLEHIFQNVAIANIGDATGLPAGTAGSLYIALFTTTPTDSTAGTECAFGAYARQAVARASGAGGSQRLAWRCRSPARTESFLQHT